MANRRLISLIGAGIVSLGLPLLAAEPMQTSGGSEATAIQGTLLTRKSDVGSWVPASGQERVSGKWYKTAAGGEAVVSFSSDVQVRMAPETVFHVTASTPTSLDLQVETGKIMTSVPTDGKTTVKIDSPAGDVHSSAGTFMLSVGEGQTKMEVMDGTARLIAPDAYCPALHGADNASRPLPAGFVAYAGNKASSALAPMQVAHVGEADLESDGPDTRRRPQNEVRNEQTRPTNVGEDVPTTSPTVTETPAFTPEPTFTPTFTPPPSPSPPPTEQGAVIEGDEFPWELLLGAAGIGGLIYALLPDDDDDGGIIIPASP